MPNVDTHPYAFAWYILVSRFSEGVRGSWKPDEKKKISEPQVVLKDTEQVNQDSQSPSAKEGPTELEESKDDFQAKINVSELYQEPK